MRDELIFFWLQTAVLRFAADEQFQTGEFRIHDCRVPQPGRPHCKVGYHYLMVFFMRGAQRRL